MSTLLAFLLALFPIVTYSRSYHQHLFSDEQIRTPRIKSAEIEKSGATSINCLSRENETSSMVLVKCTLPPESRPDAIMGCFALWNNDAVIRQGCWEHQDVNSVDCDSDCRPSSRHSEINFCCCVGEMCNMVSGFY
ncbi:hypothetical protein WR25_02037 isoform A [Diploscapter pachys]|uniref:Uncharacterized protein n=1 Tax=Diploscapter pachys TaxID=2018661 RepID=A0A2A2K9L8_9BILA|nr:hypothetical protein WR25_02037 isoform A [Diploscapter pachys]